jgi:hypothetical protein
VGGHSTSAPGGGGDFAVAASQGKILDLKNFNKIFEAF